MVTVFDVLFSVLKGVLVTETRSPCFLRLLWRDHLLSTVMVMQWAFGDVAVADFHDLPLPVLFYALLLYLLGKSAG